MFGFACNSIIPKGIINRRKKPQKLEYLYSASPLTIRISSFVKPSGRSFSQHRRVGVGVFLFEGEDLVNEARGIETFLHVYTIPLRYTFLKTSVVNNYVT